MTLFTVTIFLFAMLAIGLVNARRANQPASFFVADRRAGPWLLTGSLLATILGASATLGQADLAYRLGLPAVWWLLAGAAGLLLLAFGFAAPVRRLGVYTLPEVLEAQYGGRLKQLASALIAVAWLGVIAAQIVGIGQVLAAVTGGHPTPWILGVALVLIAYTALGGQMSVLRTDAWQLLLILVGLLTALALAWRSLGGWAALAASLPAEHLRFPVNAEMPPARVLGLLLAVGLTYTMGPDMISRLLCARDERVARQTALAAALALVPLAFVVAGFGLLGHLLPARPDGPVLLAVAAAALPGWAAGWLTAALLAAMMSSASTCLLTTATIVVVDLGGRSADPADLPSVGRSRWAVVLVGLASLAVALKLSGIIAALLWAYTIYTGGLIVPVMAGFWRQPLGLTAGGAWAAILGGGATAVIGQLAGWPSASLLALAVAAPLLALVSRFDSGRRARSAPD